VGIYSIIKYNEVPLKLLMFCIKKVLEALVNFEMQEEVFLNVCFELLIFIGPTDINSE